MATYRKKLLDKDGNTIIPAMAGDETGWVKTADLANSSVTTAKIADSAATTAKIADTAVTTAKIADGAVTNGKIDWTTIPTFVAYVSGTDVLANDKLTLGTSIAGAGFSLNNNELVCSFNADYVLFMFQGGYTSGYGLRLMKNGVEQRATSSPGANMSMVLCAGISVSNGDRISLECFGVAATVYPYSYLYAFKIR